MTNPARMETNGATLTPRSKAAIGRLVPDRKEKLKRDLVEGEMVAFSCGSDLLLSTGNAGALSLWVDGRECLPLGERGAALQDFLLNSERVAEICPPEENR